MMNKEPIGLYIFRFMIGLGLFAFMIMLYWSSVLLEVDVKELKNDINQLKSEVLTSRLEVDRIHDDVMEAVLDEQKNNKELMKGIFHNNVELNMLKSVAKSGNIAYVGDELSKFTIALNGNEDRIFRGRHQIDPKLPNLLKEDMFYADTIPKMLDKGFVLRGVRRTAMIGKPDNLHPFNNFASVSSLVSRCIGTVATMEFGKYETMAPDMAVKMEHRVNSNTGKSEFWVHLRDNMYWEPLQQEHFPDDVVLASHFLHKYRVTAHDFKFFYDAIMNPYVTMGKAAALRTYYRDIEDIEVVDDLTFIVRWKSEDVVDEEGNITSKIKYVAKELTGSLQPLARFVYQYFTDGKKIVEDDSASDTYRTNSVWAQNFAVHWAKNIIVSCGPWIFDGMTDRSIRLKRNSGYHNPYAVLVGAQEITFRDTPDAVWQDFKLGKLDTYGILADQLIELEDFMKTSEYQEQKFGINRLDYLGRSYNYIGWNQASPFFRSKKVRKAMTYAVDRKRIINQNLNGMAMEITGPFSPNSPSYDATIESLPYDPQKARRLLEEDGWYDSEVDGIRDKEIDGKRVPFRFSLTYYVKNPTTKANAEYIVTALKDIGVECVLNGVGIADLSAAFDEKSFDAIYLGWSLGSPPEDPRQLWHSAGSREKGSSNAVGFENKEVDSIIEALQYEYDIERRVALYRRFHAIVYEEAPYIFLYAPESVMLYRDYVQNVFIPKDRQDLIPGANVSEPDSSIFWFNPPPEE